MGYNENMDNVLSTDGLVPVLVNETDVIYVRVFRAGHPLDMRASFGWVIAALSADIRVPLVFVTAFTDVFGRSVQAVAMQPPISVKGTPDRRFGLNDVVTDFERALALDVSRGFAPTSLDMLDFTHVVSGASPITYHMEPVDFSALVYGATRWVSFYAMQDIAEQFALKRLGSKDITVKSITTTTRAASDEAPQQFVITVTLYNERFDPGKSIYTHGNVPQMKIEFEMTLTDVDYVTQMVNLGMHSDAALGLQFKTIVVIARDRTRVMPNAEQCAGARLADRITGRAPDVTHAGYLYYAPMLDAVGYQVMSDDLVPDATREMSRDLRRVCSGSSYVPDEGFVDLDIAADPFADDI